MSSEQEDEEQKLILLKSIFDFVEDVLTTEIDPLHQYVVLKEGNTTVYHIPNMIFMNFDISEIKKRYSHFDWQLDSRCSYCKVTTVLRETKLLS